MTTKTKYRITYGGSIQTVQVSRETEHFATICEKGVDPFNGRPYEREFREKKEGRIFDTFIAARSYLIDEARKGVELAEERLRYAREKLARAENLRGPD